MVYGYPALVSAIDLQLELPVTLEIKDLPTSIQEYQSLILDISPLISSTIPVGSGLGSSAALAVALSAIISLKKTGKIQKKIIATSSYELEKFMHGTPSGVDNTVCTYGGLLWYRKETDRVRLFDTQTTLFKKRFFLISSGRPEETTKEMVQSVRELREAKIQYVESIFKEIEAVTRQLVTALQDKDQENLKKLLTQNQRLLEKLPVVSSATHDLIHLLEHAGAAAKVAGAGGRKKGSGMILAYHSDEMAFESFLKSKSISFQKTKLGAKGVTLHE